MLKTIADNDYARCCMYGKNVDNTGINQYDSSTRKHSSSTPQDYVLELYSRTKAVLTTEDEQQ